MKKDKKSTKISDNYSIRKDRYQWILIEHYLTEGKDGNAKELTRDTYHSTLEQVAKYLINNQEQHSLDKYIRSAVVIADDINKALFKVLGDGNENLSN